MPSSNVGRRWLTSIEPWASSLEMQRLLPLISECVTRVVPHDFAGGTLFEGDKDNMKAYVLTGRTERNTDENVPARLSVRMNPGKAEVRR